MKIINNLLIAAVFSFLLSTMVYANETIPFNKYLEELRDEARSRGFSGRLIDRVFADITLREKVVTADKNQPERVITLDTYLKTRVPDWKVKQALTQMQQHAIVLDKVSKKYGVPKRFIVALWGNESNFGRIQGNHHVLSALASLAYDGRRETLFKKQFFAALSILQEKHIEPSQLKGSWAGAMGQTQFMPSSFLTYAVDANGDGKKDIWSTPHDVFASIANYLQQEGWQVNKIWGRQVKLASDVQVDNISSLVGLSRKNMRTLPEWQALGVLNYEGNSLPNVNIKASLIMPDGPLGRIYLVYENFHTLMKWNRSAYFGISVSYLADRIKKGE